MWSLKKEHHSKETTWLGFSQGAVTGAEIELKCWREVGGGVSLRRVFYLHETFTLHVKGKLLKDFEQRSKSFC